MYDTVAPLRPHRFPHVVLLAVVKQLRRTESGHDRLMSTTPTTTSPAPAPAAVPAAAYMLADHLDAALASGEDILAAGRQSALQASEPVPDVALRSVVELVRALELALITRVLKAREWSRTLQKSDRRFNAIAGLFLAGTNPLTDALAQFADATDADFETGDGITAYFRSRGCIDGEAAFLPGGGEALIGERFRLASRIELGPLLDLIAAYLDAMEDHFVLFHTPSVPSPVQSAAAGA